MTMWSAIAASTVAASTRSIWRSGREVRTCKTRETSQQTAWILACSDPPVPLVPANRKTRHPSHPMTSSVGVRLVDPLATVGGLRGEATLLNDGDEPEAASSTIDVLHTQQPFQDFRFILQRLRNLIGHEVRLPRTGTLERRQLAALMHAGAGRQMNKL